MSTASNEPLILFTKLLNAVKNLHYVPKCWKQSYTRLIYKNNNIPYSEDGYRPISLLSVSYKIYSFLINERIMNSIENFSLIPNTQNGFRNSKETLHCLYSFIQIIKKAKETNKDLHVLYIDFCKAFDSVPHWAIQKFLLSFNFGKQFTESIMSVYKNIYSNIFTCYGLTENVEINCGVHQGDVLSPTLFILFLAPLLWKLKNTQTGFPINSEKINNLDFADDITLIGTTKKEIKECFKIVSDFANDFHIDINAKKSAYAWISDSPVKNFSYKGAVIERIGSKGFYKYLGFYINLDLNPSKQMEISSTTYKNCVKMILQKKYLDTKLQIKLINSVAQATIAYRMNFVLFPKSFTDELDKWTCKFLCKSNGINSKSDNYFWFCIRKLQSLTELNKNLYLSAHVNRILNKPDCVSFQFALEKFDPQSKPKQNIYNFNGFPPIQSVANYLKYHIVDVQRNISSQTNNLTEINDFDFSNYRGLRNFQKQINNQGISSWSQFTDDGKTLWNDDKFVFSRFLTQFEVISKGWQQLKQNILLENSFILKLNLQNSENSSPIPIIPGDKVRIVASEFNAVPVWTDGSKRIFENKETAFSACWFSNNNRKNICFYTVGQQTSFNAELQAIEYAIMNVVDSENIIIFTDCKPAIQIINRYLLKKNCQKTNPTVNRIIQLIQLKKSKFNASTTLKQCFSHLFENEKWNTESLQKLQKERIEMMKSEFNNFWQIILLGNQQADKLAQSIPTVNNKSKLSINTNGLPRFLVTNSQTNYTVIESNILQVFKQQSKDTLFQKWIEKCPKRTADMINPLINWNKSIWPLLEPCDNKNKNKYKHKNISNFQQKLCQKLLPTKKFIFEQVQQYEKNGWSKSIPLIKQKKMKLKYKNNLCDICNNMIANTKHCFSECVRVKDQQKNLVDNLLLILNEHKKNAITSFKWWFSSDYRRNSFGPTLQDGKTGILMAVADLI